MHTFRGSAGRMSVEVDGAEFFFSMLSQIRHHLRCMALITYLGLSLIRSRILPSGAVMNSQALFQERFRWKKTGELTVPMFLVCLVKGT